MILSVLLTPFILLGIFLTGPYGPCGTGDPFHDAIMIGTFGLWLLADACALLAMVHRVITKKGSDLRMPISVASILILVIAVWPYERAPSVLDLVWNLFQNLWFIVVAWVSVIHEVVRRRQVSRAPLTPRIGLNRSPVQRQRAPGSTNRPGLR